MQNFLFLKDLQNIFLPELLSDTGLAEWSTSSLFSPTSFSCLVMLVRGKLGFIEGFLFIVPVNKKKLH